MVMDEQRFEFECFGATHVGVGRSGRPNQDALAVREDLWAPGDALVVVADGMGGPPHGDLASGAAVEALVDARAAEGDAGQGLATGFRMANVAVREIESRDAPGRPGTTLVAGYFLGSQCWLANVGDSRADRLRAQELERLSRDHSVVQEEIDAGRLAESEARVDPRSSLLTRTIGGQPNVEVDVTSWDLEAGDRFLVCSDGLWGILSDEVISTMITEHRDVPHDAVTALIEACLDAGAPDNVTAVVVGVEAADRS
jgi:protein phosphatase